MHSIFTSGREVVIASKHKKEQVIAPLLHQEFQMNCTVLELDTDQLGTFTGEIERTYSPVEAVRKKCELAMEISGKDLAIASEGSFGYHPNLPLCKVNEEIVLLYDRQNDIEIFGKEFTLETNFSGTYIETYSEVISFARKVGFPRHALILRENQTEGRIFVKGLDDVDTLRNSIGSLLKKHPRIWLETDMRAMYNPTRMKAIQGATENLIARMKNACPECSTPGFWIDKVNSGLPCSLCRVPTRSTLSYEYACNKCQYRLTVVNPHGTHTEDPMYCDRCNP